MHYGYGCVVALLDPLYSNIQGICRVVPSRPCAKPFVDGWAQDYLLGQYQGILITSLQCLASAIVEDSIK